MSSRMSWGACSSTLSRQRVDGQSHMDIVLIGARDIETVWRLHSAYRDGAAARLRSPDVLEVLWEGFQV